MTGSGTREESSQLTVHSFGEEKLKSGRREICHSIVGAHPFCKRRRKDGAFFEAQGEPSRSGQRWHDDGSKNTG
jgi:hypothetical protein